MGVASAQPGEVVWQGRLWPLLLPYLAVLGVFVTLFAIGIPASVRAHEGTVWDWLAVGLIATPIALIFALSIAMSPRRLTASKDGLVLRRWLFGTTRLKSADIAGVRASYGSDRRGFRSVMIEVRGRGHAARIMDVGSTLGVRPAELLRVLQGLYGRSPLEEALRTATASEEAARLSQIDTRWRARYPRHLNVFDAVALLLVIAGAVFWRPLWTFMVEANGPASVLTLFVVCGVGCYSIFSVGLDIVTGGAPRELVITGAGLTVRRRWRDSHLSAEAIRGARQVVFFSNSRQGALSRALVVLRPRGFGWSFREEAFDIEPKGLLAGVLLHRFGEWLPASTSARPAV
jgi:hypothetical protein